MKSRVHTSKRGDVAILSPEGELDLTTADLLWEPLNEAVAVGRPIVVDFTRTEFLDSWSLAVVIDAARRTDSTQPVNLLHLVVKHDSQPQKAWNLSGTASFIPTFATLDEALAAFAGPG